MRRGLAHRHAGRAGSRLVHALRRRAVQRVLDRGLRVAIGAETGVQNLNECSLVVAPYQVEGADAGSIGVLGPTHMNYPQALAAVAVISNQLGEHLTRG